VKDPELIPFPGVLGGTMGFYEPKRIRVLPRNRVLAPFEDGHIEGELLLHYRVDRDGAIHWQVLKSLVNQ
jgi:hypothetical protein